MTSTRRRRTSYAADERGEPQNGDVGYDKQRCYDGPGEKELADAEFVLADCEHRYARSSEAEEREALLQDPHFEIAAAQRMAAKLRPTWSLP